MWDPSAPALASPLPTGCLNCSRVLELTERLKVLEAKVSGKAFLFPSHTHTHTHHVPCPALDSGPFPVSPCQPCPPQPSSHDCSLTQACAPSCSWHLAHLALSPGSLQKLPPIFSLSPAPAQPDSSWGLSAGFPSLLPPFTFIYTLPPTSACLPSCKLKCLWPTTGGRYTTNNSQTMRLNDIDFGTKLRLKST